MAKRFVDTEIWKKEWFQVLNLKQKVLVKYIFENCDCAGIWNSNFRMASFIIGENVSLEDLIQINEQKQLFEFLDEDKVFVIGFIEFQYGKLSEKCKPHIPIIALLKKYGLFDDVNKVLSKGTNENEKITKGYHGTLEEKEKEKEKEIEKEKDKESFSNDTLSKNFVNPDLMYDKNVEKVFTEYESKCKNCLPLKFEKRNLELRQDIFNLLKLVNFDFGYIVELCKKANDLKKIYENPIDLKALIKNHERIYSGFYAKNVSPPKGKEESATNLSPEDVMKKAGW